MQVIMEPPKELLLHTALAIAAKILLNWSSDIFLEIKSFDFGAKGGMEFLDREGLKFWLFTVAAHGVYAGFDDVLLTELRFTVTPMKLLVRFCLSSMCSGISWSLYTHS